MSSQKNESNTGKRETEEEAQQKIMSAFITKPFDVSWRLVCLLDHNVDGCCHVGTVDQGEETLRMEAQKDNR